MLAIKTTHLKRMKIEIITQEQIDSRTYWINEISRLSGNFGVDAEKVEEEIRGIYK